MKPWRLFPHQREALKALASKVLRPGEVLNIGASIDIPPPLIIDESHRVDDFPRHQSYIELLRRAKLVGAPVMVIDSCPEELYKEHPPAMDDVGLRLRLKEGLVSTREDFVSISTVEKDKPRKNKPKGPVGRNQHWNKR